MQQIATSRGRTPCAIAQATFADGPSPRVRGEPALEEAASGSRRAIPACAGRTCRYQTAEAASQRAIPACAGRTRLIVVPAMSVCGPSPRVRGELEGAGQGSPTGRGHPRVCGENVDPKGSRSTRSRAIPACAGRTPQLRRSRVGGGRAIPACAGRTRTDARKSWNRAGPSPRVRGELETGLRGLAGFTGHPRVCGENYDLASYGLTLKRAIPACAGRTIRISVPMVPGPGPSPRVRGERPGWRWPVAR